MISFFLQAQGIVSEILAQPGDTVSSKIIFAALIAVIMAVGGVIAWIMKTTVSKFLDNSAKQTETLTKAVDVIPQAVDGLKDTVIGLKEAMITSNNAVITSLESVKDQIIDEVRDQKIQQLASQLKDK